MDVFSWEHWGLDVLLLLLLLYPSAVRIYTVLLSAVFHMTLQRRRLRDEEKAREGAVRSLANGRVYWSAEFNLHRSVDDACDVWTDGQITSRLRSQIYWGAAAAGT